MGVVRRQLWKPETIDALYARWSGDLPAREEFENDPSFADIGVAVICDKVGDPTDFVIGVGGLFSHLEEATSCFNWGNGVPLFAVDLTTRVEQATVSLRRVLAVGDREPASKWAKPSADTLDFYPMDVLFGQPADAIKARRIGR